MTAFSKVITNRLNVFGPAPSSKWNVYNWNAFKWGEGTTDLVVSFYKVIGETLTLADSLAKMPIRTIDNSLTPTSDMTYEAVLSGSYYRVFPGDAVNGENQVITTWANGSSTTPTWASGAASSTSWSAA